MNKKGDNLNLGVVLGMLIPMLSILLIYAVNFSKDLSICQFIETLFILKIYTKLVAVAVYFGNLVSFFLFIKTERLKSARGVLMATVLYTIAIFILNFTIID